MPRVVLALDSFKGSITAADAVAAIAAGLGEGVDVDPRPMADGGEGTVAAFAQAVPGAELVPVTVTGPRGERVDAAWLRLPGGTGVVELASTSGIELLGDERRGWDADTAGFGEAIAAALDAGVTSLVVGIGSSASTDGGIGMLAALGARFVDADGAEVAPGLRGLETVAAVDLSGLRALPPGGVVVLSDVTSPLTGPGGAAEVFGPQKGLDPAAVTVADDALERYARLAAAARSSATGRSKVGDAPPEPVTVGARHERSRRVGLTVDIPGSGAAGGTGFGLLVWGAQLRAGAPEVAALIGLRDAIAGADLVVTGEGSFDGQSAAGKVPALVSALAADAGVPVAVVAGRIAEDADTSVFAASVSLTELAGSPEASLSDPARWLRAAGARLTRTL